MGSLMGGWDSTVNDPRTAKFQRNKSLTKEEIGAFWISKKKSADEHLRAISEIVMKSTSQESTAEEPERKIQGSSSVPLCKEMETETSLDTLVNNGWWTRSNSAFLN